MDCWLARPSQAQEDWAAAVVPAVMMEEKRHTLAQQQFDLKSTGLSVRHK
jgi:hypothetical protein